MFVKAVRAHGLVVPWVVAFVALAWSFWFLCDDAYISFRFSRNWAHGLGVVFNPGEVPPVEGYSNFLWVAVGAVVERIGGPIAMVMPAISVLCGVGLVLRIDQVAARTLGPLGRTAALAMFVLCPAIPIWATSGLATLPFAWLFFELIVALVMTEDAADRRWVTGLVIAMALLRVEGIAWVAVIAGVAAFRTERPPDVEGLVHRWAGPIAIVAAVLTVYMAWRIHHFGTWVPNTALVKVGFDPRGLWRGVTYVASFGLVTLVPVLAFLPGQRDGRLDRLLVIAAAVFAYAIVVGGDFMPFGRLLVPAIPLLALRFGHLVAQVDERARSPRWVGGITAGLVLMGALPLANLHPVPLAALRPLHFRHSDKEFMSEVDRWANQRDNLRGFTRRGQALAGIAEPGDAVVSGAVGAIGYFSGLEVWDQHGLVTKEVAYREVPDGPLTTSPGHDKHVEPSYFVKYAPRFLYARTVTGALAAGKMKDTLEQWHVPLALQDRYVPDFWDVTASYDAERTFLLVVRRLGDGEDPQAMWEGFASRRRELNAELRDLHVTTHQAD